MAAAETLKRQLKLRFVILNIIENGRKKIKPNTIVKQSTVWFKFLMNQKSLLLQTNPILHVNIEAKRI